MYIVIISAVIICGIALAISKKHADKEVREFEENLKNNSDYQEVSEDNKD